MVISQGDIWWAALPEPVGSGPGFDRSLLTEHIGRVSRLHLELIWKGLDLLFDRY